MVCFLPTYLRKGVRKLGLPSDSSVDRIGVLTGVLWGVLDTSRDFGVGTTVFTTGEVADGVLVCTGVDVRKGDLVKFLVGVLHRWEASPRRGGVL